MIAVSASLEMIASDMFQSMADAFPVASSSDEFHYFPQVAFAGGCEEKWDSFSPDAVEDFATKLSGWEGELDLLKKRLAESGHSDSDEGIDVALLLKVTRTLKEQLSDVRFWEYQPTFYLTLACLGMADAIESENPAAKHKRAERLSAFLDQAGRTLTCVPLLFRALGLEMLPGTRDFFEMLQPHIPELKSALIALDRFENSLKDVSTRDSFHLPQELVKRILRFHINSGMDIEEIQQALDQEIHAMEACLQEEARRLGHQSWEEAYASIPLPDVEEAGLIEIYRAQVEKLGKYCLDKGLVSKKLFATCPVRVAPMPSYLSPIRTASSYSIRPQSPPRGGSFYLISGQVTGDASREYHREYRTCFPPMRRIRGIICLTARAGVLSELCADTSNSQSSMKDGHALQKSCLSGRDIFPARVTRSCWRNGDSGARSGARSISGFRPVPWTFQPQPDT
jgi:hypothetical protein